MNTYEVTCSAIALVKVTVQAEGKHEADVDLEALPTSVQIGNLSITFKDWEPETTAEVSA